MGTIDLADLGITPEKLTQRIVEEVAGQILDPDERYAGLIDVALSKRVKEAIDNAVSEVGAKVVDPGVKELVDTACLQRTNEWGEKKGEDVTFKEYIVERAEAYLSEEVDYQGRTYAECRKHGSSWTGSKQTRVTLLVDGHLKYSISSALEEALLTVNSQIAGGIAETVKLQLEEASKNLRLSVSTKR